MCVIRLRCVFAAGLKATTGAAETQVSVRYLPLPRATSIRLVPMSEEFRLHIKDAKSALEAALTTSFTTLHSGQLVSLRYGARDYPVLVAEVQPAGAPAVVVQNTDVSVVIEYPAGGGGVDGA